MVDCKSHSHTNSNVLLSDLPDDEISRNRDAVFRVLAKMHSFLTVENQPEVTSDCELGDHRQRGRARSHESHRTNSSLRTPRRSRRLSTGHEVSLWSVKLLRVH